MTRIDTLAELLTRPDTDLVLVGEVGRDFTTAERDTLLAALRLAEAAAAHNANCLSNDSVLLWQRTLGDFQSALADYRSARQRLAGNAP